VASAPIAERFRAWLPGGRVCAVPLARFADRAPETSRAVAASAPDVAHVNLVDPGSNAAVLASATALAPTVATLHLAGDWTAGPGRDRLAALYRSLDLLLTPAHDAAHEVAAARAAPRLGVVVQQNGVDLPADPHGPAGAHPARIGVHCRLTRQKGVDVLVEATRLLVTRGVPVEVVVAGSGRDEPELRRLAAGLPVSFAGWATEPRAFLAGLDVFCLPSRREAMPLALLEALAEALPCVATDVGDVAAVVGGVVAIVPPEDPDALADALAALVADPEHAAALGRRGRRFAEQHLDATAMAARTFGLLRRVADLSGAGR
jgi:glycosyltransferase involved in cell wall biosynthesis